MNGKNDSFWMSISDLFAGLMLIFLLISTLFMIKAEMQAKQLQKQNEMYKKVGKDFADIKANIYNELKDEFEEDLNEWNAVIVKEDLAIRFLEPSMLFEKGKSDLKPDFTKILDSFLPRYTKILTHPDYINEIDEVRIEGHTSSEWKRNSSKLDSYILNMGLSQERSKNVLWYWLNIMDDKKINWLISNATANGLSYSKIIRRNGEEDSALSRRVEFRIKTKTEEKLRQLTK